MITSYYYKGPANEPWEFQRTDLGSVNLLVGASGSGKTKYLNTIFNFSDFVVKGAPFKQGFWELAVRTGEFDYLWECTTEEASKGKYEVSNERLRRRQNNSQGEYESIVERTLGAFHFQGAKLPKLQIDKLSVTLLKEEDAVKPLYETFARVQRRNFHDEGLRDALALQPVPNELVNDTKLADGIRRLWSQENALSAKLFLLKESFPDVYKTAVQTFEQVFPSIIESDVKILKAPPIRIRTEGLVPVFLVKEKGVNSGLLPVWWTPAYANSACRSNSIGLR